MSKGKNIKQRLVDVSDCVLTIIDIQDSFLNRYDNAVSQSLLTKSVWIIEIAKYLGVPIIAMAEDIEDVGQLNQAIRDALPKETVIYNKDCFNLADNPEILAGVETTGRKTAVLIGVETDICVAQSALGLIEKDYQVVVLRDVIATTAANEETGISRMRDAGVVISSVRSLYYEWQRSVTNCKKLRALAPQLQATKGQTA